MAEHVRNLHLCFREYCYVCCYWGCENKPYFGHLMNEIFKLVEEIRVLYELSDPFSQNVAAPLSCHMWPFCYSSNDCERYESYFVVVLKRGFSMLFL